MSREQTTARLPPIDELVNVFEFEQAAKLKLPSAVYADIAGSDRAAFDRLTFRPRMMVSTMEMDLGMELFGEKHFAPILAGPVADQRQYHAEGELATLRGASAAQAAVIISSRSSVPIEQIAAQAKTPFWYSVYADPRAPRQAQLAVAAGCRVVAITIGASVRGSRAIASPRTDWRLIDQIHRGLNVPVLLKGVMTPEDARSAIDRGMKGVVVSNHGGAAAGPAPPIEVLSAIADAVGDKAAVLIDGSFRRGSDILKALVLGANAVVLARPLMWGLAAYGADGVRAVLEMLQSDLARNMGALGAPNLASLNRSMVRIHRR